MKKKAIVYIHGKGGSAGEASHYSPLFPDFDVIGFDYRAEMPWEAKSEFRRYFDALCRKYESVSVIANSIGAFFAMNSPIDEIIGRAYLISPVVDMEKLIVTMMGWANVTETELRDKKEIETAFGETLSWDYYTYVREHPLRWTAPTDILYGEHDNLTDLDTISSFAEKIGASLRVMPGGEHWFHTREQMDYLDDWIRNCGTDRL